MAPQKKKKKKKTRQRKNRTNIMILKVNEVVLAHLADNQYQQKSEVLWNFTPDKSYGYLLNVEPNNLVF